MLVFIGLGLFDEKDLTIRALEVARSCDELFAEFYTSRLAGTSVEKLEALVQKDIIVLGRGEVESGGIILSAAARKKVGFLVPGDPLISTTHSALRLEASQRGIETRVVHNTSIHSAASALSGLFNYKFGRSASIPFPEDGYRPESYYDVLVENQGLGLHTLLFLDIKEKLMKANEAIALLLEIGKTRGDGVFKEDSIIVGLGCVGSDQPALIAGKASEVAKRDLGPVPHVIIVPGRLHFMEEEYLKEFGGL